MTEIRVGWPSGLHEDDDGQPIDGGLWFPDIPEVRRDLEAIVECGCEAYGPGTHWLGKREA